MPRLSLFFARRYLFSRKSHSVINIISGVSAFSVAVPVMAMVVLLSVFNGFEGLIKTMYRSFDPDLAIMPARGQVFATDSVPRDELLRIDGVREVSYSLDGNALLEYRGHQFFGMIRGVDSLYAEVVPVDSMTVEGQYRLRFGDMPEAFVGQGVASALGVRTGLSSPITVYVPRRGRVSPLLPYSFYRQQPVFPSGVFALEAEIDGEYVFVPLDFAQRLFDYSGRASTAAVRLADGASAARAKEAVAECLGNDFRVLTRYEQKESFYRIMTYEKWGIYFIILLVLLVASFSLIGSLAMLIIDKRKDIRTLMTLGADVPLLRKDLRLGRHDGLSARCGRRTGARTGIGARAAAFRMAEAFRADFPAGCLSGRSARRRSGLDHAHVRRDELSDLVADGPRDDSPARN